MATISIPAPDSRIFFLDSVSDVFGFHAEIVSAVLTGTDATFKVKFAPTVYIYVDGVLTQPTLTNDATFRTYTLFSGLTDSSHDVKVYFAGAYGADPTAFLTLTGANPSVTLPSWAGPWANIQTESSYILTEGNPRDFSTFNSLKLSQEMSVRFIQKCSSVTIVGLRSGVDDQQYTVLVDGVEYSNANNDLIDGALGSQVIASGLDPSVNHDIVIVQTGVRTRSYIRYIIISGVSQFITTPILPRKLVAFWGDSITDDEIITDGRDGFVYKTGKALNVSTFSSGNGGSKIQTLGGEVVLSAQQLTINISGLLSAPALCVVEYGTNDNSAGQTYSTLLAAVIDVLTKLRIAWPSMYIIWLSRFNVTTSNTDSFFKAIPDGVMSFNDARCKFLNYDGISVAVGDALHPIPSGYTTLANRLLNEANPIVSSVGYSIFGSSSGTSGSPVVLSIIRSGGTLWMTGDMVSLSDGASGTFGAFTFTSGVSNVATITYTTTTPGAKTITPTNGQGWTDPSPFIYTSFALIANFQLIGTKSLPDTVLRGLAVR